MIATQPDMHVGRRGSVLSVSPLRSLGKQLSMPVHDIRKGRGAFKTWTLPDPFAIPPDGTQPPTNHILVTASFGRILTGKMLNSFQPDHRLNVHPSLLPAYRGPAPIQHTLINGEGKTGVCVIQMLKFSEGIDAGPIFGQKGMPVAKDSTFESLRSELGPAGGQVLVSVLRDMMSGKVVPRPQAPAEDVPRAPLITASDTLVDFKTMRSTEILGRFRALSHQRPLVAHTPEGKPLHLCKMRVVDPTIFKPESLRPEPGWATLDTSGKILSIRCAEGTVLGVTKVKPEGKPFRYAQEFWHGLKGVKSHAKQIYFGNLP
ncbi:hypothetical protein M413DRAFT_440317 [Hebeloma cylindrosporum]|uniref:Methionyl-tRNA formyltransferase n=1 Tax=Hebeloma cylindrosporum TaxID=76867 RepID=A0A0C3CD80_HEBCY|nr:hypothetical protein M413DRAFT_440317 [Hebeloma cylindrosporum h7]